MALVVALAGCVSDETDRYTPVQERETFISVNVPGLKLPESRALDAAKEMEVGELYVLVFSTSDNTLVKHYEITDETQIRDGGSDCDWKFSAPLADQSGVNIVVVANANTSVGTALSAAGSGADKVSILTALELTQATKWDTGASYQKLPMYGETTVSGTITTAADIPTINLRRMHAKVNVTSTTSDFVLSKVHVVNYNTKGRIAPTWNTTTGAVNTSATTPNLPASPGQAATTAPLSYNAVSGVVSEDIYLFESDALSKNPATPSGLRLVLEGTFGGATYFYPADFTSSTKSYIPVLRNHAYLFTVTAATGRGYGSVAEAAAAFGVASNLRTSLLTVDQSDVTQMVWNGEYYLGGDIITVSYKANDTKSTQIVTNYATSYTADNTDWSIDPSYGSGTGIVYMETTTDGTGWLKSVARVGNTLSVTTNTENPHYTERRAKVYIKAGRLVHAVIIRQLPGAATAGNANLITYVGAFWRAGHMGERLITIDVPATNTDHPNGIDGKWKVEVLDYHTGDQELFKEGEILFEEWDGTVPNTYPSNTYIDTPHLTAGKTTLTGEVALGGKITFKIGLTTSYKPTAINPARYARVLVSLGGDYGSNKFCYNSVLWLRQGEQDDYLMAPGDTQANGTTTFTNGRADAKKWSPYNLTAKTWVNIGGDTQQEFVQINKRTAGGSSFYEPGTTYGTDEPAFTAYPTMAGAFFQWSQATDATGKQWQRRAFNPGLEKYTTAEWNSTSFVEWKWNNELHETCPQGYRRPNIKLKDGNSSDFGIPGNEAWQSFVSGTSVLDVSANSAYGYYADGYFDRLQVETANGLNTIGTIPSVVAKGGKDAAYIGRIIFNPNSSSATHHNASLFIPAAGYHDDSGGLLRFAGSRGYGWSRLESPDPAPANDPVVDIRGKLAYSCYVYLYYNIIPEGIQQGLTPHNHAKKSSGFSVRCVVE